jgi:hypothetical protein
MSATGRGFEETPEFGNGARILFEIMVIDQNRFTFPSGVCVLDAAEHLLLLGVNADDGVDIQPGPLGNSAITAMTKAQALQPCIKSALPFIERAQKQDHGCLGIVGRFRQRIAREGQCLGGPTRAPMKHLFFAL